KKLAWPSSGCDKIPDLPIRTPMISNPPATATASHVDRTPNCHRCALRQSGRFTPVTETELNFVQNFRRSVRQATPGTVLIRENSADDSLYTLYAGWAFRYKTLSDGRRQILNFLLPGDFIGMQQNFSDGAAYGVEALTATSLCAFPQSGLLNLFQTLPSLGFDVTWLAASQKNVIDENLLTAGRRTAAERVATLLLQLFQRAERVGLVVDGAFEFPLNQQHVADALGLSLVHTNKTMRRLLRLGLYRLDNGWLRLLERKALAALADHDDAPLRPVPLI
ncbi:MAG: Crp/Fnr family transcriptional regulator, partial [Rhodoferax sp.]|nr:Crp/Fnr family transcriptional regulator [Rhodoferax sp.]